MRSPRRVHVEVVRCIIAGDHEEGDWVDDGELRMDGRLNLICCPKNPCARASAVANKNTWELELLPRFLCDEFLQHLPWYLGLGWVAIRG
jgi:hypothetical protein